MTPLKVVVLSKTASNLWPCINAVRAHDPGLEIIVVDDGVDWQHSEWTWNDEQALNYPRSPLQIVAGDKPFVFARNANIGIRAAGDGDVILLNDDALLESDGGFRLLQAAAHQHPDYGIIGAVTNLTGQPLQQPRNIGLREVEHIAFVCVLIPARTRDLLTQKTVVARIGINRLAALVEKPDWADSVFTNGFLDERYTKYGCDDADYCMQIRRAGLKIGVHDGAFVDHASLHSSYRGEPEAPGDFSHNYKLLIDKWGKIDW